MNIVLHVNGTDHELNIAPEERLLDTLRERLHITSPKRGCENGDCGACTVLVDRKAVTSCIYLTARAAGKRVETVEAFAADPDWAPLFSAFRAHGSFQCGFCAPGTVLSVIALLSEQPHPSETEIRNAMYGNLCRCSGYVQIVEAVKDYAAQGLNGDGCDEKDV